MPTRFLRIGLIIVTTSLAGCGGGGGDGGGSDAPSNPPPPPPSAFAFTDATAMTALAAVLGTVDEIGGIANAMSIYTRALMTQWPNPYEGNCVSGGTFSIAYVDADTSASLSTGDVVEADLAGCTEFDRSMTLTVSELEFSAVTETLAGTIEFETTKDGVSLIDGSFDMHTSNDGASPGLLAFDWTVSNVAVRGTLEGEAGELSDVVITYSQSDEQQILEFSGRHSSSEPDVEFRFETTAAFVADLRSFPTQGSVIIDANTSVVQMTAIDGLSAFEYAIDATANGDFGAAVEKSWFDVAHGFVFYVSQEDTGIIAISELEITPPNPRTWHALDASFVLQNESSRPTTTRYRWYVNDSEIETETGSRLPASRFVKGDAVRVVVTVDDGVTEAVAEASTVILNAQPGITATEISPAVAYTTDTLVVNPSIYDADDDAVAVDYAWFVNDAPTAYTGNSLPADAHVRGDTVYVVITASDGESTTSETSPTITIQDSPPQVSAVSPPTTATLGGLVSFDVTAEDPDLEPTDNLTFLLDYGPAGMEVDPATGTVTWLADMPMFDRTMNVAWGVTVDDPLAVTASGTIALTDPDGAYPLARTGIEIPLWGSGLQIGDFDSDGTMETLIVSQRSLYELKWDGAGYSQSWMYPFTLHQEARPRSVAAGDIDGDGYSEIFVSAGDRITRLDGVDRRASASASFGATTDHSCIDLVLADLDRDGDDELICLQDGGFRDGGTVSVIDPATLEVIWSAPEAEYGSTLAIGNVDADAALEIVTGEGYVYDGATFVNEWVYGPGFGIDVGVGDFDGDGTGEIAGLDDWTALRGYSAVLRSPLWEVASGDLAAIAIVDLEDDGTDEILVGDGQWGNVTAYRYDADTNAAEIVFQINSQDHGVTSIAAGDVDADGELEFVWGTGATSSGEDELVVAGRNPDIEVEWTNVDPIQLDGPFYGGVEVYDDLGNGRIAFLSAESNSGYGGSRIVAVDPETGSVETSSELGSNWSGGGAIAASDYDDDNITELFVSTAVLYDGFFSVYDYFADASEWTSPDDIGTGVAIDAADINEDGHEEFVVIASDGVIYVFDVFAQTIVWQSTTLSGGGVDVRVFDLDNDGVAEIVAASGSTVFVYEKSENPAIGYIQRDLQALAEDIADIEVGDTDGDGEPEIFAVTTRSPFTSSEGRVIRLDTDLNELNAFDTGMPARGVYVARSPTDDKLLLVTTFARFDEEGFVIAYDSDSGTEVWRSPGLIGGGSRNSLHYVDVDGETQIALGTNTMMYVTR